MEPVRRSELLKALLQNQMTSQVPMTTGLSGAAGILSAVLAARGMQNAQKEEKHADSVDSSNLALTLAKQFAPQTPITLDGLPGEQPTTTSVNSAPVTSTPQYNALKGMPKEALQTVLMNQMFADPSKDSYDFATMTNDAGKEVRVRTNKTTGKSDVVYEGGKKPASEAGAARQKKIDDAMKWYGISESEAGKLVDGYKSVSSTPDERGFVTITDLTNGSAYQVSPRGGGSQQNGGTAPVTSPPKAESFSWGTPVADWRVAPGVPNETIRDASTKVSAMDNALTAVDQVTPDDFRKGSGPMSNLVRGASSALEGISLGHFGLFGLDEKAAENRIALANQKVKAAIVNNERFPVSEQDTVGKMLPDPSKWATAPEEQAMKMSQVKQQILQMRENQQALVEGRQAKRIERPRTGMKNDPLVIPPNVDPKEFIKELPAGVFLIDPTTGQMMETLP